MKTPRYILVALMGVLVAFSAVSQEQSSPEQLARQGAGSHALSFAKPASPRALDFVRQQAKQLAAPQQLNIAYIGRKPSDAKVTLTLTNIPVLEALKLIAHQADLSIRATANGIYLYPKDEQPDLGNVRLTVRCSESLPGQKLPFS